MDTLGHLLALRVTPANQDDRAQVGELVQAVQEVTGEKVEVAFVDQGYTWWQMAVGLSAWSIGSTSPSSLTVSP